MRSRPETEVAIERNEFPTLAEASAALSSMLAETIRGAIAARGDATLALSGGRTPRHVLERLRMEALDWSAVTITLTDERWVEPTHADSNERLVRTHLVVGPAAEARMIPLYGGEAEPHAGVGACEERLASLTWPLDAVYLGMGADGHVASLFPGSLTQGVWSGRCAAVDATDSRSARMTLTVPALTEARRIFLLFAGGAKRSAFARALEKGPEGEIPLRAILRRSQAPVSVLEVP